MKFGICVSKAKAPAAIAAGADYTEISASALSLEEDFKVTEYQAFKPEVCNLFLVPESRLFSADPPFRGTTGFNHFRNIFLRTQKLKIDLIVFGSGNQRRCPENLTWPLPVDENHLWYGLTSPEAAIGARTADWQEKYNTVIAVESLNRSETNVGNDCGSLAIELAKHDVPFTADAYHILYEWNANGREGGKEAPSREFWAKQIPFAPAHVHVAQLEGRLAPKSDDAMLKDFFARLAELGYDGRVSLECNNFEIENYAQALADIRLLANQQE
jgi:sugar phosphate isomerase/epimerase